MAADPEGAKAKTVEALSTRMDKADWYSSFSDDSEVRKRGSQEIGAIYSDLKTLGQADPEAARALWQKHAPADVPRPQYLTSREERKEREEASKELDKILAELYPEDKAPEARKDRQQQRSGGREP